MPPTADDDLDAWYLKRQRWQSHVLQLADRLDHASLRLRGLAQRESDEPAALMGESLSIVAEVVTATHEARDLLVDDAYAPPRRLSMQTIADLSGLAKNTVRKIVSHPRHDHDTQVVPW